VITSAGQAADDGHDAVVAVRMLDVLNGEKAALYVLS
jgi:hypothetical protein